jgi:hypothetical protein
MVRKVFSFDALWSERPEEVSKFEVLLLLGASKEVLNCGMEGVWIVALDGVCSSIISVARTVCVEVLILKQASSCSQVVVLMRNSRAMKCLYVIYVSFIEILGRYMQTKNWVHYDSNSYTTTYHACLTGSDLLARSRRWGNGS